MLNTLNDVLNNVDNFIWGMPLIILILFTGILLTVRLRGLQIRHLGKALHYVFHNEVTAAYTYAPAREISVYDYTQIMFSAIMGLLVFGQLPDMLSFVGYCVIIAAGVIMFLYNKRRGGN